VLQVFIRLLLHDKTLSMSSSGVSIQVLLSVDGSFQAEEAIATFVCYKATYPS
jgi:hypothetical protein